MTNVLKGDELCDREEDHTRGREETTQGVKKAARLSRAGQGVGDAPPTFTRVQELEAAEESVHLYVWVVSCRELCPPCLMLTGFQYMLITDEYFECSLRPGTSRGWCHHSG